jgi:hypothetical protein
VFAALLPKASAKVKPFFEMAKIFDEFFIALPLINSITRV